MSPESDASRGTLGPLVRERREALALSMDQLAQLARVSRSSIHRLEHGDKIRPTPSKLARVLAVVGVDADAVAANLPDDEYRGDVLHWLSRAGQAGDLAEIIDARRAPAGASAPDLVIIHPDGTVARIHGGDEHLEDLSRVLKAAGWLVTRPD